MIRILLLLTLLPLHAFCTNEPLTPFEKSGKTETSTYAEAITFYRYLADNYDEIGLFEYGETDAGKPLHLILVTNDGNFEPDRDMINGKRIIGPVGRMGINKYLWL